ncbi:C26 family cysteine hydrolase domain-containing family [Candidatus Woesearchaeota archaeon]|jgi:GMP synthase (glutamine-hydrolysing)|nr:C26 family cysteine hydrolase domain-containing family [Candidatus Woesearchaeota archaeon]
MILVVCCGSKRVKEISQMAKKTGHKVILRKPENIQLSEKITGIVISGSPVMIGKHILEYKKKFAFLKKIKIPIFGICFGHQVVGVVFGSKVSTGNEIKCWETINILKKRKLFLNLNKQEKLKQDHREQITLPKNFELLAKSKSSNVEAMKHKTKEIYGVQFHPEISGDIGKKIMKNFYEICEK